jgi:hypothetical protein
MKITRIKSDSESKTPVPPVDGKCEICKRDVNTWAGISKGLFICHHCKKAGK